MQLSANAKIHVRVLSQTLSPPITSRFKCLTNGCCDQHEWCRFWASIGECQLNEEWMSGNCQLACGTCTAGSATPARGNLKVIKRKCRHRQGIPRAKLGPRAAFIGGKGQSGA
ncbi:shTK domain protein [Teladorsagia circumcincta]|uniref:ShTK domain protein n=1 Tax=Teladorsagia circumcincta TaxID=45464 RepID=A0A2G9UTV1_TELCI|nr:shTK domain protein [Teladorsagia circumcincta]